MLGLPKDNELLRVAALGYVEACVCGFAMLAESPKVKVGGLAFDVIFKPASVEALPIIKTFSPCKEISQEAIERKLKEAEERRMVGFCERQHN